MEMEILFQDLILLLVFVYLLADLVSSLIIFNALTDSFIKKFLRDSSIPASILSAKNSMKSKTGKSSYSSGTYSPTGWGLEREQRSSEDVMRCCIVCDGFLLWGLTFVVAVDIVAAAVVVIAVAAAVVVWKMSI